MLITINNNNSITISKACLFNTQLNTNYLDLIYATANRYPIYISPSPNIFIYNNSVLEIFNSNTSSLYLNNIAISNSNFTNLSFYTDGSVRNLMTNYCSMSIGWIL